MITDVADKTIECTSSTDPSATGTATATDSCGTATVAYTDAAITNACGNTGEFVRTWTATDECGNTSTSTQTITIVDHTPPVITDVDDQTIECTSSTDPSATGAATATDSCGDVVVSHTDSFADSCGNTGVITRTWTATDECGNSSTSAQTITIVDHTPPVITDVDDQTIECTSSIDPSATGTATATDSCGTATVAYTDAAITNACGNTGEFVRTWTATDECGNTASSTQTITIVDTTPPVITDVADKTIECTTSIDPSATGSATASDSCGSATVSYTDGPMTNACGNTGVFVRTWTATDECGNSSESTQTITVVDTTPPVITDVADKTIECTTSTDPSATGTATATDSCGTATVSYTDAAMTDACGNTGVFVRTWTATDECGNTANSTQTITIVDHTPPTLTVPPDKTVECTSSTAPSATGQATGSDTCGSVVVTYTDLFTTGPGGTGVITRTWKATDECGNITTRDQKIIIVDTTLPTITLNGQTLTLWPPNHKYVTVRITDLVASASDSCDPSVNLSRVYISKVTSDELENSNGDGNTFKDMIIAADCKSVDLRAERDGSKDGRVYTIYFSVTDGSGKTGVVTAKVTVPHNQGPTGGAVDSGPKYTVTSSNCP